MTKSRGNISLLRTALALAALILVCAWAFCAGASDASDSTSDHLAQQPQRDRDLLPASGLRPAPGPIQSPADRELTPHSPQTMQDSASPRESVGIRWSHYRFGDSPVDADGLFAWTKPEAAADWLPMPALAGEAGQSEAVWLRARLPPDMLRQYSADPYLLFTSAAYSFEVYSGATRLYSSGDLTNAAHRWQANRPVFVSLDAASLDKPLLLRIHSKRSGVLAGKIGLILYGSQADLKLGLIKRDLLTAAIALIYFMIGFVALLMYSVTRDNKAALYFALFALSICGNQLLALNAPELFMSFSDWKRYTADPLRGLTLYWFTLYFIHVLQPPGQRWIRLLGRLLLAGGVLLAGCKLFMPGAVENAGDAIANVERLGFSLLCACCLVVAALSLRKPSDSDAKWFVGGLSVYLTVHIIGQPLRYYLESNIRRFSVAPLEFIQVLNVGLDYSLLFGTCFFAVISFKRYKEVYEATRSYNRQLADWNRSLEAKVRERTVAIQNLLDHADQGFLTIDERLVVQEEHSSECTRLFEREIAGVSFIELLYPDDAEEQTLYADILHSVFHGDDLRREVCLSLLPAEVDVSGKSASLQYKWIAGTKATADQVMIVMTDRSERRRMEQQMAQERQSFRMVVWVVKHGRDFAEMVGEYRRFAREGSKELMASALTPADKWSELYRAVHTFKGNFAQIDFIHTTEKLHEFESRLAEWEEQLAGAAVHSDVSSAFASWFAEIDLLEWMEQDLRLLRDLLGAQYDFVPDTVADFVPDAVTIRLDRLHSLERQVQVLMPGREAKAQQLAAEVKKLRYRPFRELLDLYPEYAARLAERSGKELHPVRIAGGEGLVDPELYTPFTRSLVHLFRNMVDHGLEMPEQRASIGKDRRGTIWCEI